MNFKDQSQTRLCIFRSMNATDTAFFAQEIQSIGPEWKHWKSDQNDCRRRFYTQAKMENGNVASDTQISRITASQVPLCTSQDAVPELWTFVPNLRKFPLFRYHARNNGTDGRTCGRKDGQPRNRECFQSSVGSSRIKILFWRERWPR